MLTRFAFPTCVAASLLLAGCESDAHQDNLTTRGATAAVLLPANSIAHSFHPRGGDAPDSVVAYTAPSSPTYADRPLDENLSGVIELADYTAALQKTGLMAKVARSGPFTVFAAPNEAMESHFRGVPPGQLFSASALPATTRLMGYTIVHGRWTEARFRKAIARSATSAIALRTLSGDLLTARLEAGSNQLLLSNASGQTNRIWIHEVPQSNGMLYLTQSVLTPG